MYGQGLHGQGVAGGAGLEGGRYGQGLHGQGVAVVGGGVGTGRGLLPGCGRGLGLKEGLGRLGHSFLYVVLLQPPICGAAATSYKWCCCHPLVIPRRAHYCHPPRAPAVRAAGCGLWPVVQD